MGGKRGRSPSSGAPTGKKGGGGRGGAGSSKRPRTERAGGTKGAPRGGASDSDDDTRCEQVCDGDEDTAKMLLCDGCDRGFHFYCLPRPMLELPPGEHWWCEACSNAAAEAAALPLRVGSGLRRACARRAERSLSADVARRRRRLDGPAGGGGVARRARGARAWVRHAS